MYLLTHSGKLLSYSDETKEIVQLPFRHALEENAAIDVPLDPVIRDRTFRDFIENNDGAWSIDIDQGPLSGFNMAAPTGGRVVSISGNNLFMSAEPAHAGSSVRVNRTRISDWEQFVLLSNDDIEIIDFISTNDWVVAGYEQVIPSRFVTLGPPFALKFGTIGIDLRYNTPLTQSALPFKMTLLRDGWRIVEFFLYKPAFVFTAFKSPEILKQLYIAVDSLVRYGGFQGQLLLITDQKKSDILKNLPFLDAERLLIFECQPPDWVGYVASKYLMLDQPEMQQYQPIIFSDPDMVFDSNLTRMLAAVATSDRIAAPVEHDSFLHNRVSVGAELIAEDGLNAFHQSGINAGTLAIPNLVHHAMTLKLIANILMNRSKVKGREHHKWVDQEVANYVSFRTAKFDQRLISPYVRYGFKGVEEQPDMAAGVVHFFPPAKAVAKRSTMESYLGSLDQKTSKPSEE
jgi:hypothetical protein